jgi:hypothetical protein
MPGGAVAQGLQQLVRVVADRRTRIEWKSSGSVCAMTRRFEMT